MKIKQWYLMLGIVALVVALFATGAFMVSEAMQTKSEIRDGLARERLVVQDPRIILTYPDARAPKDVEVPKVTIDTAEKARAQAEVIRVHLLALTGGKTYSELPKDDPKRDLYIKGVTLETALYQAYTGFEIVNLVTAVGVIFMVLGVGALALGVPLVKSRH